MPYQEDHINLSNEYFINDFLLERYQTEWGGIEGHHLINTLGRHSCC